MDCGVHLSLEKVQFVEATKYVYVVCLFISVKTEESVSYLYVRAKNSTILLKTITIPNLELLACLIAARIDTNVKKYMKRPNIETH